jgi:hypothetical protein
MAGEIEICKAPDPLVFRLSGFGSFFLAKRAEGEDEHLVLFGTISMIGGGIEILYHEKMRSEKMHKVIKDFEESPDMPICINSDVDELKKYLFGAFAFGLSRRLLEKTDEAMNAFEMLGGFANEKEWLGNLVNNDLVLKSELVNLINKYGLLKEENNKEEAVFTEFKLRIASNNINEIIDNLAASDLFVITKSNSKESVLDLVGPADPKLVGQIMRYLKSGRKEGIPGRGIEAKDVDLSTLLISKDGKEVYKEIGELSIGKNGKVEISAKTISGASAAVGYLIKAGARNLRLESVSYKHWKELMH